MAPATYNHTSSSKFLEQYFIPIFSFFGFSVENARYIGIYSVENVLQLMVT